MCSVRIRHSEQNIGFWFYIKFVSKTFNCIKRTLWLTMMLSPTPSGLFQFTSRMRVGFSLLGSTWKLNSMLGTEISNFTICCRIFCDRFAVSQVMLLFVFWSLCIVCIRCGSINWTELNFYKKCFSKKLKTNVRTRAHPKNQKLKAIKIFI